MLRTPVLALGLVVAGCAAPAATLPGADPAAPTGAAPAVSLAPLAAAPQPELPTPLRPTGPSVVTTEAAMDHGAHAPLATSASAPTSHAQMGHDQTSHSADARPLALALDAYLSVQEALAADDLAPVSPNAQAFADAWANATEDAPDDDPHFWHMRAEGVATVRAHALALAGAASLDAARTAFGHLSAALVPIVEARGAPAGLSRFVCGMRRDLPEGGVWLQRGAEPRNPYFGARMLTCAVGGAAVPARTGDSAAPPSAAGHEAGHGAMDHTDHDG